MARACLAFIIACSAPLAAQWLHYPTPGIPRTADGKPNLAAPAPRTADGKPDLSGLWEKTADRYYNNITVDLKPGDVLPWADALYRERKKSEKENPIDLCQIIGPSYTITPYHESRIMQTPKEIAILNDDLTFRQVYMDGRKLEPDPNPTWMGYSVGHWDGDTLVVESNGFNDKTWLDTEGHPHTEALRMTERYRRIDFGHIQLQVTFDDPKAYAKPITASIVMDLVTDTEMLEYVCDNEKDQKHLVNMPAGNVVVPAATLAAYAGVYEVKDGGKTIVVEVTTDGKNLYWNYDGAGKQKLDVLSQDTFSLTGTQILFQRAGTGPATGLIIRMVEGDNVGVRRK
jgi:hypothetical protein